MNTQASNLSPGLNEQETLPAGLFPSHSPLSPMLMQYTSGARTPELIQGAMLPLHSNVSTGSMVSISPAPMMVPLQSSDSLAALQNALPVAQLSGNSSPLTFPAYSPQGPYSGVVYTTPSPLPYGSFTGQMTTGQLTLPMATVHTAYPLLQPPSPVNGYTNHNQFQFHNDSTMLPHVQTPDQSHLRTQRSSQESISAETYNIGMAGSVKSNNFQEPRRGPGPQPQKGQRQKKYAYRSKQKKIDRVYNHIKDMYLKQQKFAAEKELVRGDDTLRIHVKTFDGLSDIVTALNEVEQHHEVETTRLAAVFSKKNKFQKKGFIVYLKLGSERQREIAETIFKRYSQSLKNVATAKAREDNPTSSTAAVSEEDVASKPKANVENEEYYSAAPPLRKLNSAGYAA